MRILMIARSTLYSSPGGDTTQIEMTANYLKRLGVNVDIKLSNEQVTYEEYDLLHFFNIIRPDDILPHVQKTNVPYVISTILVDYFEYEKNNQSGLKGLANTVLNRDGMEYVKVLARSVKNREKVKSLYYLINRHKNSIQYIAQKSAMLLPNSHSEYQRFVALYGVKQRYQKVVNAIDPGYFHDEIWPNPAYNGHIVCVGRIEGRKNQLNLIKALIDTDLQLTIIGKPSPNHIKYYQECVNLANTSANIHFIQHIDHTELAAIYKAAKVHVLPSWFETTGLSSLEAGAMGCNLVITPKGDTQEYFGDMAYYCEPDNIESIRKAVLQAYHEPVNPRLKEFILNNYTWAHTARQTLSAYEQVLHNTNKMHIAIIGTRGIPNNYGGFEQAAQYLALGLVKRGFTVTVYNSHNHPYQEGEWNGVKIIHAYDPEEKVGTAGQFLYDYNCITDLRKRDFDIILQLGYTSSSIWGSLIPKKYIVTTNMDGLEWKRTKFSKPVQTFLQQAEKLAVRYSNHLISDSIGIQDYLKNKYNKDSVFIPYGAYLFNNPDADDLIPYKITPYEYDMLIARLEPENSIEIILDGVVESGSTRPFIVVGKHQTKYGEYLKQKFAEHTYIRFVGGIYNMNTLNNIRYYSRLYFHGHTVGGTNPSLLEAMASDCLICANDNPFNRYILEEDGLYFQTAADVASHIRDVNYQHPVNGQKIVNNRNKIQHIYSWDKVIDQYADHFLEIGKSIANKNVNVKQL